MKLSEIIDKLNLKAITQFNLEVEITDAYTSDLLSDVMGKAKAGQIWITMQTHRNVTAICALKDMPAVILTANGTPDSDMLEHADSEEICILQTPSSCFEICGKLYELLKK